MRILQFSISIVLSLPTEHSKSDNNGTVHLWVMDVLLFVFLLVHSVLFRFFTTNVFDLFNSFISTVAVNWVYWVYFIIFYNCNHWPRKILATPQQILQACQLSASYWRQSYRRQYNGTFLEWLNLFWVTVVSSPVSLHHR